MSENPNQEHVKFDPSIVEYDYPQAKPGQSIVINTSRSVFVRIVDDDNYRLYREGADYRAFQGQIHSAIHRFKVPYEAHWHVLIDPNTFSGIADLMVRLNEDSMLDS